AASGAGCGLTAMFPPKMPIYRVASRLAPARDTRRRHRMPGPMHAAGPTTPEPGSREPGYEPEPGPDEPGPGRHGRHAGDADPLPPLDGPMPGRGPSPAETTLPLALEWPAPPPRALRTPRFTPTAPPGSVDAPPGWRRVPRTTEYRLPEDLRPRPPQPGYRPLPGAPP